MSSDSEESQTSAHNDDQKGIGAGSIDPISPVESRGTIESDLIASRNAQEEEQQELASLDSASNGLTFARTRRPQREEDEETSTSELAILSATKRPGTPESTSTPDDTPSIQVR